MTIRTLTAVVAALSLAQAAPALRQGSGQAPALILHNARIYTGDANRQTAEAIAISGDRIVRVGANTDVLSLRGSATRVIDVSGGTIVPGLEDAHGHFTGLGASMQSIDLRGTTTYEQVVGMVRQRAATARPGEWIVGRGWDQNDWPEKQWPTHELLSAASPNNPVYLTRVDGHAGLANRRALDLAGVTEATADPAGGRLIRAPGNQPSGVLIDTAQSLVSSKIPRSARPSWRSKSFLPIARCGVSV
jgi:predicted amidohydrolase YtcJ